MDKQKLFWLHVKKAGGTSMREVFTNSFYILQDERYTYPCTFKGLSKNQWNDILNNYRIPLGRYDYKRMLFAKKFLYSNEEWANLYKFVVVRNPYDRILSNWKYLFRRIKYDGMLDAKYLRLKFSFNYFLKQLPNMMGERFEQIYHWGYIGLHAAPIWPDITDEEGNLLVDKIVHLENYNEEIKEVEDKFGVNLQLTVHKNKGRSRKNKNRHLNKSNIKRINNIYSQDIENLGYERK